MSPLLRGILAAAAIELIALGLFLIVSPLFTGPVR